MEKSRHHASLIHQFHLQCSSFHFNSMHQLHMLPFFFKFTFNRRVYVNFFAYCFLAMVNMIRWECVQFTYRAAASERTKPSIVLLSVAGTSCVNNYRIHKKKKWQFLNQQSIIQCRWVHVADALFSFITFSITLWKHAHTHKVDFTM